MNQVVVVSGSRIEVELQKNTVKTLPCAASTPRIASCRAGGTGKWEGAAEGREGNCELTRT